MPDPNKPLIAISYADLQRACARNASAWIAESLWDWLLHPEIGPLEDTVLTSPNMTTIEYRRGEKVLERFAHQTHVTVTLDPELHPAPYQIWKQVGSSPFEMIHEKNIEVPE